MTDVKHTPLPWAQDARRDAIVRSDNEGHLIAYCGAGESANAEFIVKACNSYYKLLRFYERAIAFSELSLALDSEPESACSKIITVPTANEFFEIFEPIDGGVRIRNVVRCELQCYREPKDRDKPENDMLAVVLQWHDHEWLKVPNFGKKSLSILKETMLKSGLELPLRKERLSRMIDGRWIYRGEL